jgi:hypothetical protein
MTLQAAVEDTISCAGLPRDQLGTEAATHNAWVMVRSSGIRSSL